MSYVDSLKNSDIAHELNSCSEDEISESECIKEKRTSWKNKTLTRKKKSAKSCLKLSVQNTLFKKCVPKTENSKTKKSKEIQQNEGEIEEQIVDNVELTKKLKHPDNLNRASCFEREKNDAVSCRRETGCALNLVNSPGTKDTYVNSKTKGMIIKKVFNNKIKNSNKSTNNDRPKLIHTEVNWVDPYPNKVQDKSFKTKHGCGKVICGSRYDVVTATPVAENREELFNDQSQSSINDSTVNNYFEKQHRTLDKGSCSISKEDEDKKKVSIIVQNIFSVSPEKGNNNSSGRNINKSIETTQVKIDTFAKRSQGKESLYEKSKSSNNKLLLKDTLVTPSKKEEKSHMWKEVSVSNKIREYTNKYCSSSTRKPKQTYSDSSETSEDESMVKSLNQSFKRSKEGHNVKQFNFEENSASKEKRKMDGSEEGCNEIDKAPRKGSVYSDIKSSPFKNPNCGRKHLKNVSINHSCSRLLTSSSSSDSENDPSESTSMTTNEGSYRSQLSKHQVSTNQQSQKIKANSYKELSDLPSDKYEERSFTSNTSDLKHKFLLSTSSAKDHESSENKSPALEKFLVCPDKKSGSCNTRTFCDSHQADLKHTYFLYSSDNETDSKKITESHQPTNLLGLHSLGDENVFRKGNFDEKSSMDIVNVNCRTDSNIVENENPNINWNDNDSRLSSSSENLKVVCKDFSLSKSSGNVDISSKKTSIINSKSPRKLPFHHCSPHKFNESSVNNEDAKFLHSSPDSSDVEINFDEGPKFVSPVFKNKDKKILSSTDISLGRPTRKRNANTDESEATPSKISRDTDGSNSETNKIFSSKKKDQKEDSSSLDDLYIPSWDSPRKNSAKKNLFSPEKINQDLVILSNCSTPSKQKKGNQNDKENIAQSSSRHKNESTPQKSSLKRGNLSFDKNSETDSPVKYKMTPLKNIKPAQTPTKRVKADSNTKCERGTRTPTKQEGEECLEENEIENELSEDNFHRLSPRKNISDSASKPNSSTQRELKRLNIDCEPSLYKAPSPVRKSRPSVLRTTTPQKSTPQKNTLHKHENSSESEDEQSQVGSCTPHKNKTKSRTDCELKRLNIDSVPSLCSSVRKRRPSVLKATTPQKSTPQKNKPQKHENSSESEDEQSQVDSCTPRKNKTKSCTDCELKRLNIDCVPSSYETPSPVRKSRPSVLKATTPQKRDKSGDSKESKKDEEGQVDCFTPHKREAKLLSAVKGTPLSPSVKSEKFKQNVTTPIQRHNISANTPVSKKKSGRGFLTPSMAKKERINEEKEEDDLDTTRRQLHISTIPTSLPCRDTEFDQIRSFLLRKIEHSAGGCMYISGVPGTGKTATVHAVVRSLQRDAADGELPEFDFVEVNGLRLTEPRQAYVRILQALTGRKLSPDQAQQLLSKRFSHNNSRATVVLVDELDYLCNRRQDVVYNILDWPSRRGSALTVLTISNTMDLPERTLKGRVTSRMGLTRVTFQPYSHHQLRTIVQDRLSGSQTFHPDAVQLVARKVAAVSGDARRALDICRRTTELVKHGEQVTVSHVERALTQIFSGPRVAVIQSLSREAQLVLRAIRDVNQRTGVDEAVATQVYQHLLEICLVEGCPRPTVGSVLLTCVSLASLGLIVAEKGRADIRRKMSLNVSSDDIHYALDRVETN